MYTDKLMYTQYGRPDMPTFRVEINASVIRIVKGNVVVFDRTNDDDNWYDDKHKKIVDAIHKLEAALDEAIGVR